MPRDSKSKNGPARTDQATPRTALSSSTKASETLISHLRELVESAVATLPGIERRKMLVSQGWFAGGKVFTLVARHARIIVHLPDPAAQAELLALDGAGRWQFGKKAPLREWLELPESMHEDEEALRAWLERAYSSHLEGSSKKRGAPRQRSGSRARSADARPRPSSAAPPKKTRPPTKPKRAKAKAKHRPRV